MNQQVSLDDAFGTIRMHVSTQSAIGEHKKPKPIGLLAGTLRVMGMIIRSRLDGSYKQNPFFIPGTGDSFVTPKVLNQDLKGSSIQ
jgi:hypothetical protein